MLEMTAADPELVVDDKGPIERFSWGSFVVWGERHAESDEGHIGAGKDIRIVGDTVSRWKERKGHLLKKKMISGVYDHEVEVLVLGLGVHGCVECPDKVVDDIKAHGIRKVVLEKTPDACRTFNALYRKGKRVALLAHGTC
jgi:hypothetical protein